MDEAAAASPSTGGADDILISTFNSLRLSFENIPVAEWTVANVVAWLQTIGLSKYVQTFSDNDIDGKALVNLTEDELRKDLNVTSLAHRKTIRQAIEDRFGLRMDDVTRSHDDDYEKCRSFYAITTSNRPTLPAPPLITISLSYTDTAAQTEVIDKAVFHVNFPPGQRPVAAVPVEADFAALYQATKEDAVQPAVSTILQALLRQCNSSAYMIDADNRTGGFVNLLADAGHPHPDAHKFAQAYNPDHVVLHDVSKVPTGLLVVESKTDKTIKKPSDIAKFIRDLDFVAALSDKRNMPGVIIAQSTMYVFELFRGGKGVVVLRFPDVHTNDATQVCRILAHGIKHGTFLAGAGAGDADVPHRFTYFIGRGRTSVVFATASSRWPVAKVLLKENDTDAWKLALHEVTQVDALFCQAAVKSVDHFMDATLDPTRAPRRQPAGQTDVAATVVPPTTDQLRQTPIVFYSRRCKELPANYFRSDTPDFKSHLAPILDACRQMHQAGVVHNDLRESNLMVDSSNDTLVLGDFGFSQRLGVTSTWVGGTIKTASPSLLSCLSHAQRERSTMPATYTFTEADDLWSVASLCLYADDRHALAVATVATSCFPVDRLRTWTLLFNVWDLWGKYHKDKWQRAASILKDGGPDSYASLQKVLELRSKLYV
jgi:hypothetical protein